MKMRGIWPALVFGATLFLLPGASAWAQKIKTGYDKSADFSQYKTYAWIPRATPATNRVLAAIIDHDIEYELNEKGLRKVDGNADLLVQSYGGSGEVVGGYAAEPGYTGTGGYAMPSTTMWGGTLPATPVPQIMHGTITVDLVDARQKELVWRATAKGKMDYNKTQQIAGAGEQGCVGNVQKIPAVKAMTRAGGVRKSHISRVPPEPAW
jgi:hypothetical protein